MANIFKAVPIDRHLEKFSNQPKSTWFCEKESCLNNLMEFFKKATRGADKYIHRSPEGI